VDKKEKKKKKRDLIFIMKATKGVNYTLLFILKKCGPKRKSVRFDFAL